MASVSASFNLNAQHTEQYLNNLFAFSLFSAPIVTLEYITIDRALTACIIQPDYSNFVLSYSPLFSGTGWRCCWSAGRAHCASPPGCGRRTHSSSVLTGAGAGSWQLRWLAWSPRQGCRSGSREGSVGNPAETQNKRYLIFFFLQEKVTQDWVREQVRLFNTARRASKQGANSSKIRGVLK